MSGARRRALVVIRTSLVASLVGSIAVRVTPARAQGTPWSGSVDASANMLYGAARSRVASLGASLGRADSALQVRSDVQLTYADALDGDDRRTVTARAARGTLALDRHPYDRVSPFVFGTLENSYQQRIAVRTSGGAGAKYTFRRRGDDDLSLSLAVLAERTRALHPDSTIEPVTTRLRWSWRARVRQRLGEAVRLTHVTFYQPEVDHPRRYTIDANTVLAVSVAKAVALTSTWRERYDSEARSRGARSNHDGQLLFGVRATF